ncbi:MAG: hypothetical protein GXP55_26485 [Deltaproteobacteria bacterium]|nr:hypothetical protein [Deltaproteobacteria bacterium]
MTLDAKPLPQMIADWAQESAIYRDLFAACEAAGHNLTDACEMLTDPWDRVADEVAAHVADLVNWNDLLYHLVEYAGPARAAEVAATVPEWRDVDVVAHHRGVKAQRRADGAITDEVPIGEAYALVADEAIPARQLGWLLHRMARVYGLEELAALAEAISPAHATVVAGVLRAHMSPLSAFEELLHEVDADSLLRALEIYWDIPRSGGTERDALLATYARLTQQEFKPLARVLPFARARGEPAWWLPMLRENGLRASQAALVLLESGAPSLRIAELLAAARYSHEQVFGALLENGIGTRTSIAKLRESGWSADQMVRTFATRGVLLPEVRCSLEDLGVPASAQRPLLVKYWEESLVDLVLSQTHASLALTSGEEA